MSSDDPRNVASNEHFVTLIQILRDDDDDVSRAIRSIIQMIPQQRRAVIMQIVKQMETAKEDRSVIEAVSALYDDAIVARIRQVVNQ
jgi:hypothetical protein